MASHTCILAFKWEVHLGANMLILRTSLAGRMNMTIYIFLRVQDDLQVQEQKELQSLNRPEHNWHSSSPHFSSTHQNQRVVSRDHGARNPSPTM
jgi:hypothetical protein